MASFEQSHHDHPRLVERILEALTDRATWTTIVDFLMMLPVGTLYFATAVTGLAVGLRFGLVSIHARTAKTLLVTKGG